MEALLDGKGDYHSYRSPTFTVPPVTDQAATISSLHVGGVPSIVSFFNQVQERIKQQSNIYAF